ncbi:MAG: BREX-4 system phosphatase PglZ [Firmicutes bacterium]|nr:BREX-4 system phosphatase PglZ [Bacillota bacterium]
MQVNFSSIKELLDHLRQEKRMGDRFATRFILVQGCEVWDELIPGLKYEVDKAICLSELCSTADVFPNMGQLKMFLEEDTCSSRGILLTPLAEYIRIDPEAPEVIRWLAEYPTGKVNRIYVPLLAAEELFQLSINKVSRYHEGLLPDIWALEGKGSSEVVVAPFHNEDVNKNIIEGIQKYFFLWSQKSIRKAWFVTQMAPWLTVQQSRGNCHVRVYMSSFDYVHGVLKWDELRQEWGSQDQWEWLAVQIKQENNLDLLAARLLKVIEYDPDQLFYMWQRLSPEERWLIWLWSKAKSIPGTYLHSIMQKNTDVNSFSEHVSTDIFLHALPASLNFCQERKKLLLCLGTSFMPQGFWTKYEALGEPIQKLSVLTDISQQEKKELILCVNELLVNNTKLGEWWYYLEKMFPSLVWYLQPAVAGDEFVGLYFHTYNRCRVKDSADQQLASLIDQWANKQLLWNYPARSELVSELRAEGARIMWVDGMGVEWVGLLNHIIVRDGGVDTTITITRGNLPTTTEANKEWETDEVVERGLDDIAHHYGYSFPGSFLKAMDVVEKVAKKALSLLAQYSIVAITSDHGLSRFAVTATEKIGVPEGFMTEAPGRFATLERASYYIEPDRPLVMDKGHLMWLTHGKFQGAGPCRGEVHGGATPEECLTPVVVLRKISKQMGGPPQFEVITKTVKLNAANEGFLKMRSNRALEADVRLHIVGYQTLGKKEDSKVLCFQLKDWSPGNYKGKLYYANRVAGEISFVVVKGIQEQDLGL